MVAPTNFNLQSLHGHTFKGFVQFQEPDGSTWFRLKERQSMTFNMRFDRVKHYTDDGILAVDPSGISHNFTMNIKLTSDIFDNTFSSASDKETLSYWIYKGTVHEPVEVIFVTSFETLSGPSGFTTENTVNLKFVLDPSNFAPSMGASGGSPEIVVSGIVLSITDASRSTTSEQ
jgi:hypothetical protein